MSDPVTDQMLPRAHRWLSAEYKSNYIPGWYEPHENLDLEVTHLGKGQGFPIRKVLPFRRWAIDANGATLVQNEFEKLHMNYVLGFKMAETADPRNEPVPNVLAFIRMKYDAVGSLVDMDYEDDGSVQKTEKYTQNGDVAPEFLLKTQEKSDKLAKLEMLAGLAKEGLLTPDQFQRKAAEMFDAAEVGVETIGDPSMIAAPARRRGRPKGARNKPKPDFAASP